MSKLVTISAAALAAIVVLTAVPAAAQRHPGPSDLRDADRVPQTAIAIPALIRSRAQAEPSVPAPDSAAGKVKVFDGAGQPDIRAAEEPTSTAKATLYGRKAGDDKRLDAQPETDEAAAARMTNSNNLKQIGLANH